MQLSRHRITQIQTDNKLLTKLLKEYVALIEFDQQKMRLGYALASSAKHLL